MEQSSLSKQSYWKKRSNYMYYHYIDYMVRALAYNAKSMIDVGSADAEYIESFSWIPVRHTLDINNPYHSENVSGFKKDFMDFKPEGKYDFVTCFQVLEHISDVVPFARKLFEIGDRVLISVPFMWEEGSSSEHIHDPVDLGKLLEWTGREPDYYIIVQEPLYISSKNKRLICYYQTSKDALNVNSTRKYAEKVDKAIRMNDDKKIIDEIINVNKKIEKKVDELESRLASFFKESKINDQLARINQEIYKCNKELTVAKSKNDELLKKINEQQEQLKVLQKKSIDAKNMSIKYEKQIHEILSSNSWRVTEPLRKLFRKFKR